MLGIPQYVYDPNTWPITGQYIFRLVLGGFLGGLIGAEREFHGREAGLRTQLLVALGACLAMVVSLHFGEIFGDKNVNSAYRVDPARVAYGVMSGIGFLGAGAILRYGTGIRGLTTAASLWCTAAIGLACGFGMYTISITATGLVLFALIALAKLDHLIPARRYKTLVLCLPSADDTPEKLRAILQPHLVRVKDFEVVRDNTVGQDRLTVHLSISSRQKNPDFLKWLKDLPGLTQITVK